MTMKISRKLLGDVFTLAVLFLSTGAFHSCFVDLSDTKAVAEGSPLIRALWTLFYIVVLLRAIPYRHQFLALIRSNKIIVSLALFSVASTIWSIEPRITLLRSFSLVVTTLIGIDFAIHYSIPRQVRMLCIVLGMVVLLGLVAQVCFPGFIPILDWNAEGAWSGAFSYKNVWARLVVLTTIVFLCHFRYSRFAGPLVILLIVAAVALILAARSMGGLVVLIATLAIIRLFSVLQWRPTILAMTVLAGLAIAIPATHFVLSNPGRVTGLLGRDPTLTGRTDIWPFALHSIARSPFLGHGYDAFWSPSAQDAAQIRSAVHWDTPNAHNGYIDVTLDLGFAGLILYCAGWIFTALKAIKYLKNGAGPDTTWPLAYLVFMVLYQLPESSLVIGNSIFWIVFVATACSVPALRPRHAATVKYRNDGETVIEALATTF